MKTTEDPPPAISVTLERIETDDRIVLNGALADARSRRIGVLFVHGLGSNIFKTQHLWGAVATLGQRRGIGVLALQTRGHDIAASYRIEAKRTQRLRTKYRIGGAGFEDFRESILDISAGIRHLKRLGYEHIVLLGHSTGANKIAHYIAKKNDRRVRGLVLASPGRDITNEIIHSGSETRHNRRLKKIRAYIQKHGRHAALPAQIVGSSLISGQRFLSLYRAGSLEDIFPYGEPKASWAQFAKIKKPILILFGEEDHYLGDYTPEQIIGLMNAKARGAQSVTADILPKQMHSFREDPNAFAQSLMRWLKETIS